MSKRFIINEKPVTSPAKVYDTETNFEILCYNAENVCEFLNDLLDELNVEFHEIMNSLG